MSNLNEHPPEHMLKIEARVAQLREMLELLETYWKREECDECHTVDKVVLDPNTDGQGEFMFCKKCVSARLARLTKRYKDQLRKVEA